MTLNIFSFQCAFNAQHQMALAAGNNDEFLAAMEAKDILDCLYLGLDCEVRDYENSYNSTSTVEEFITNCEVILRDLSNVKNDQVTIHLSNNHSLSLKEKSGNIQMQMDGEEVTLPNLTLECLYKNLVQDMQNNPDLYGNNLTNYVNSLKPGENIFSIPNKNTPLQTNFQSFNLNLPYRPLVHAEPSNVI